jgi:hypothetical protein
MTDITKFKPSWNNVSFLVEHELKFPHATKEMLETITKEEISRIIAEFTSSKYGWNYLSEYARPETGLPYVMDYFRASRGLDHQFPELMQKWLQYEKEQNETKKLEKYVDSVLDLDGPFATYLKALPSWWPVGGPSHDTAGGGHIQQIIVTLDPYARTDPFSWFIYQVFGRPVIAISLRGVELHDPEAGEGIGHWRTHEATHVLTFLERLQAVFPEKEALTAGDCLYILNQIEDERKYADRSHVWYHPSETYRKMWGHLDMLRTPLDPEMAPLMPIKEKDYKKITDEYMKTIKSLCAVVEQQNIPRRHEMTSEMKKFAQEGNIENITPENMEQYKDEILVKAISLSLIMFEVRGNDAELPHGGKGGNVHEKCLDFLADINDIHFKEKGKFLDRIEMLLRHQAEEHEGEIARMLKARHEDLDPHHR